jgi:hypothetical protein
MKKNKSKEETPKCAICGRIVRLGADSYTQSGDDYWCETCAEKELARITADRVREIPVAPADTPGGKAKVGLNDPCPCGSGKKYKRCCYGKEREGSLPEAGPAAGVLEELKEIMKEKQFSSIKETQAFLDWHAAQKNRVPVDDFQGLSPEHMLRFLHFPFSSPDLVTFPARLTASPEAPVTKLFDILVNAIGVKGLKATAKGNLPVKVVQEATLACRSGEEKKLYGAVRSETDFFDLHVTRLVSVLAGLIRKYQGRFLLTAKCRKLMTEGGYGGGLSPVVPGLRGEVQLGVPGPLLRFQDYPAVLPVQSLAPSPIWR